MRSQINKTQCVVCRKMKTILHPQRLHVVSSIKKESYDITKEQNQALPRS